METIKGTEAIRRMREMRNDESSWVELHHLTWNRRTEKSDGMRIVKRCRLRPSLPQEKFDVTADLYLPYADLALPENEQNRVCRKRLIRYVAFPPKYNLLTVKWFDNE